MYSLTKYFALSAIFMLLCIADCFSKTHHSIQHGIWTQASTWSTNTVPQDGDSIFVHHEVLVGGEEFFLSDVYLNVTDSGCLCSTTAFFIIDNSEYINTGHTAFPEFKLQNNSTGYSDGELILTGFVLTTSNSSMTIIGGIEITPENDLTCNCYDSTIYDSLQPYLDTNSIFNFTFEGDLELETDSLQVCEGDSVILRQRDSVIYIWSNGSLTYFTIPENEGWLSIQLIQENDTITDSIYVELHSYIDWKFPNIFSPNHDKVNEYIAFPEEINLVLYNRWGREIFSHNGPDLRLEGSNFPDGVYYYTAEFPTPCKNDLSHQKGWLQIIR